MLLKIVSLTLLTSLTLAAKIWAAPPGAFQGTVKDAAGKPLPGAELHLIATDGSKREKIIKTDASGRYAFPNIQGGTYQMILFVNGSIKATINNATTQIGGPTQLNFDLKNTSVAKTTLKKHTHMVYVPSATGSNLGGRWIEVDDSGNTPIAGSSAMDTVGGDAVRSFQNKGGH
jgi:Carboxypeptidase regulatory-like domain